MKLTVLGSNGWYATKTGNSLCILIETKDCYAVLDAGDGLSKLDRYIKETKPIYLLLSHFHLDHIYGLHILPKFKFKEPLYIFGQPGTKKYLKQIITHPYSKPLKDLDIKVIITELKEGKNLATKAPFKIEARYLLHADPCFGYRLTIDNKIIAFCTDTGQCQAMLDLAKNADILITECGLLPGQRNGDWPHLNPGQAARVAKQANAKSLLLLHFAPHLYQNRRDRINAQKSARKIFTDTQVGYDGMTIKI